MTGSSQRPPIIMHFLSSKAMWRSRESAIHSAGISSGLQALASIGVHSYYRLPVIFRCFCHNTSYLLRAVFLCFLFYLFTMSLHLFLLLIVLDFSLSFCSICELFIFLSFNLIHPSLIPFSPTSPPI